MATLLSFTQGACFYRQQQLFMGPKSDGAGGSYYYKPLIVTAKAKTRREDRIARHIRIRKKVHFNCLTFSFSFFLFIVQIRLINEPNELNS